MYTIITPNIPTRARCVRRGLWLRPTSRPGSWALCCASWRKGPLCTGFPRLCRLVILLWRFSGLLYFLVSPETFGNLLMFTKLCKHRMFSFVKCDCIKWRTYFIKGDKTIKDIYVNTLNLYIWTWMLNETSFVCAYKLNTRIYR